MWARWLSAVVLGLPLAVGVVGLCALLLPGPQQRYTLVWLLLMFPVWIGAMALPFVFRRALHAWMVLGGLTLLCYLALAAIKALGWTELSA
ncbi:hypothetical protein FHR47_001082 [Xanthomonas arboricola]|uniref:Transmembrane protein n=2 Tax=Xanthomonas cannabis TaxID=1885674 RepID=A0AB34P9A9_9XANT|nr:hypothetical protein [Xanthomonas cannabis]KGK58142.1 hypothetical protein NC00_09005 [Xanthomonas cannabis pv. phaseoli]MBB3800848.1 hypothetical protein [Xanthomonas cannabis]MBB3804731.1 hypothetical protein [Xanthomonas cannabis]MBB4593638.1 hypothetical protein [Xanthomonas cannabis]MBB5522210.1 hypothetical protein [Xanthomonas cannabis]